MNIFNDDFKDFILYLNQNEVEYIVVGGYAVIIRGYSRSTGDIDIWVNKTEENYIVTSVNDYVNKIKIKYSSNCMIFRSPITYKMIADKIVSSKYPVDLVMIDFSYNNLLNSLDLKLI